MIQSGTATADEVPEIVRLLHDDDLGSTREMADMATYVAAFREVSEDPNQILVRGVRMYEIPCSTGDFVVVRDGVDPSTSGFSVRCRAFREMTAVASNTAEEPGFTGDSHLSASFVVLHEIALFLVLSRPQRARGLPWMSIILVGGHRELPARSHWAANALDHNRWSVPSRRDRTQAGDR